MKEITFRFESAELAKDFLGYMSDGGGEYGFLSDDPRGIEFDYHSANRNRFGPVVLVTTRNKKK